MSESEKRVPRWYVVHTYSGYENKVAANLERIVENRKLQDQIVDIKIPVEKVIEAAKKALYTGHIGDGKIFVYQVAQVVKVRTGEENLAALADVE